MEMQHVKSTLEYSCSNCVLWGSALSEIYTRKTVAATYCLSNTGRTKRISVVTLKENFFPFYTELGKASGRNYWMQLDTNKYSRRQHWEAFCASLVKSCQLVGLIYLISLLGIIVASTTLIHVLEWVIHLFLRWMSTPAKLISHE